MARRDTIEPRIQLRVQRIVDGELKVEVTTVAKPPQSKITMPIGPDIISTEMLVQHRATMVIGLNRVVVYGPSVPQEGTLTYYGHCTTIEKLPDNAFFKEHGFPSGIYVSHPSGVLSFCGDAHVVEPPAPLS